MDYSTKTSSTVIVQPINTSLVRIQCSLQVMLVVEKDDGIDMDILDTPIIPFHLNHTLSNKAR